MRKIYVVGKDYRYANWMEGKIVKYMANADLVVFTGGADVHPSLYGARPHPTTYTSWARDQKEIEEYQKAKKLGKKLIGICRGAQLLCVMAGGSLVQDSRHGQRHRMHTSTGNDIIVNSLHHQRQYPWGWKKPNFELLGWCDVKTSPWSDGQSMTDSLEGKPEVEVALYPDIDALAIQSHPEMAYPVRVRWEQDFVDYCRNILDNHMNTTYKVKAA